MKKIIQYLKKQMQLDLIYNKKLDKIFPKSLFLYDFLGYVNNNFTSNLKDWKLVIRYSFFFKKQPFFKIAKSKK